MPITSQQLKLISGEFFIIMLTLFSMTGGAVWYVSSLDGRVTSLEHERDLGKRNTLADGMVRDEQIKTLMVMAVEQKNVNRDMKKQLNQIAQDVAVLRARE